ncbi:tRNA epoxyqueuosine(34) reductase QueG [Aeoliella mucimassa]|uniref:Epoxyqueuosine reductase n=1 Tax=Aeoliella mucimassa TaxID=2527972 RepID=A0A518AP03_9BACT|nr:tRNA epoxyqueuosine(34) reductase QueG [Aeoliella mucimassa]QDU56455.1 Epoxyqueuosine reductase [Aeoliella mucimassa]
MQKQELTTWIKEQAIACGFSSVGVAPAVTALGTSKLDAWLESGFAGTMSYLEDRRAAYHHPCSVLEGVRSLVMLTLDYRTEPPAEVPAGHGRVSRYAWGPVDYHDIIHARLKQLMATIRQQYPDAQLRGVVDTAPLLEREYAQLAGLGWIGKHTLLLNRPQGSWFFLAAVLTDLEVEVSEQPATDHCGTCTACLDVCPTDAFPEPHVLDASRCISYLTIELRDPIPLDLRPGVGEWMLGCDLCQDVCPWNRKAPVSSETTFAPSPELNPLELTVLFDLDEQAFRDRFRKTPLWRPKRRGILRNAAIVLGNRPTPAAMPALLKGLHDVEPLVRGASAWALGHYTSAAVQPLSERLNMEDDADVIAEIRHSLSQLDNSPRPVDPPDSDAKN